MFYTELPFSISSKIPVELNIGDKITFPVTVINKTDKVLTLNLSASLGKAFKLEKNISASVTLQPSEKKEIPLEAIALEKTDSSKLSLTRVNCTFAPMYILVIHSTYKKLAVQWLV